MRRLVDLYNEPTKVNPYWIGGGLLPQEGIMIFGGETGIGKTMLMLNMARDLTTPGSMLWGIDGYDIPKPATVLYVDQESGEHVLGKRVKVMFAKDPPNDLIWYSSREPMRIDSLMDQRKLERMIDETGAQVVLLDPASNFIEGSENSNDDVDKLFHVLYDIRARRPGLSFVLAHHFGKPPKSYNDKEAHEPHGLYNFRGAAKWVDSPDTVITLTKGSPKLGEILRIKAAIKKVRDAETPEGIISLGVDTEYRVFKTKTKDFGEYNG